MSLSRDWTDSLIEKAEKKKLEWRGHLITQVTGTLRESFDDEHLEASMIRRVVMDACNSISTLDFKYEARMPESLKSQGVLLKGDEADRFIHAARNYLYRLDRELGERIGFYTRELAKRMRTIQLEKMLLEQFEKELAVLEKSVTNKKMELEKINRLKGELERVDVNQ